MDGFGQSGRERVNRMLDCTFSHLFFQNKKGCLSFGSQQLYPINNGTIKLVCEYKYLHNIRIMSAMSRYQAFFHSSLLHGEAYKQIFIKFSSNLQFHGLVIDLWPTIPLENHSQVNRSNTF